MAVPRLREIPLLLRTLAKGANLASLADIARPARMAYYCSECLFLHRSLNPNGDLPQKQVWEVFGSERVPVTLCAPAAAEWFRPVASYAVDLVSLCTLCQLLQPRAIFEIGTLQGSGTLHLAANAPQAEVFTLDLPPATRPELETTTVDRLHIEHHAATRRMAFDGLPEQARIHPLLGDSAHFDFTPWHSRIDLFFIDGAHHYAYVRNDTQKALQCVRTGGVIAWHDYGRVGVNGVSRWLHEFASQGHAIYRVPGGSLAYYVKA